MKNIMDSIIKFLTLISLCMTIITSSNEMQPKTVSNLTYESDWHPDAFVTDIVLEEGGVSLLYSVPNLDNSTLKAVGITYQSDFDDENNINSDYSAILINNLDELNEKKYFKFKIRDVRVFNPYIEDINGRVCRIGSVHTNKFLILIANCNIIFFCVFLLCLTYFIIEKIKKNA